MSLEFWGRSVLQDLHNLQILLLKQLLDQLGHFAARNHSWINEEELHEDRVVGVFEDEEVAKTFEKLRDLLSLHILDKIPIELQVDRSLELGFRRRSLHLLQVEIRDEVVVAA